MSSLSRSNLQNEKINISTNPNYQAYLFNTLTFEEMEAFRLESLTNIKHLKEALDFYELEFETVPVIHCPDCWGCVVR